ncbi:MAG: hypothetical protein HY738_21110, partial [Bacteroidia bacterium]|nr:hypothetical protein [Bacteroidia bacterium]
MAFLFNNDAFAQAGEKFATGGNNLVDEDFLGSKNNAALLIKTNNTSRGIITSKGYWGIGTLKPGYPLDVAGRAHFSRNTYIDSTLFALNLETALLTKTASLLVLQNAVINGIVTIGNILTLDGAAGSITSATGAVSFQDDNLVTTGAVAIGCLSPASGYKLDVNGAAKFLGPLTIGSSIIIDGSTDQISSTSGAINFGNTNITTGGSITAANIISTGANQFNNLYVSHDLEVGSNIKCLGEYNGNKIFANQLSIGVQNPQAPLDVQGDAIIRGWIYAQNGVVVGKRFEGQKIETDTVKTNKMLVDTMQTDKAIIRIALSDSIKVIEYADMKKIMSKSLISDSVYSEKMAAQTVEADKYIKTSTITIDGENGTITNQNNLINFVNTNLKTSGNVNAGNINASGTLTAGNMNVSGQTSFNELQVANELQIGNSTLFLSSDNTGTEALNSIYTDDGDLRIQSEWGDQTTSHNTIINYNNYGNVGIGTDMPDSKLEVEGDIRINDHPLYLRYTGNYHGLGYFYQYASKTVDGPVLFGWGGGALGSNSAVNTNIALQWDNAQNIYLPGVQSITSDYMIVIDETSKKLGMKHLGGLAGLGQCITTDQYCNVNLTNTLSIGGTDFNIQGKRALVHDGYLGGADLLAINYAGDFADGVVIDGPKTVINGNIGIGTSSPLDKFQVGDKENKINIGSGPMDEYIWWCRHYIGFNAARTGNELTFHRTGANDGGAAILTNAFGNMYFINVPSTGGQNDRTLTNAQMAVQAKMTVLSNGNVGIGTTSPSSNLHI